LSADPWNTALAAVIADDQEPVANAILLSDLFAVKQH
jgi:hypothetical protein